MKYTLMAVLWLLVLTSTAFGGGEKNIVSSVLKSATVYRMGAELQHTARISLLQGNNEVVIDNVSNRIYMNSLQIGSDGNVTIMSMEFSTDFLRPALKSAIVKRLEDSVDILVKELGKIQVVLKTDQELLDLLKANKAIGGTQTGLSVAELTKMMDYYKTKTLELQHEITQYKERETKMQEGIAKLRLQIKEEEQKNSKSIGKLQLQLYCPVAGAYNFTITYVTPTASWNPVYDLRVENINKPVMLSYKAKLVQATGIDWNDVKLSLSTSVPAQHNDAPVFQSWFLVYQNPANDFERLLRGKAGATNTIPSADMFKKSELQEVVVVGYGAARDQAGEEEYKEPIYVVNGNTVTKAEYNRIDKKAIKNVEVLKNDQATAIYGSRAKGGAVVVTLKDNLGDYVSVSDNQLNVTYNIDLPYDVPSNGKEQNVVLKEVSVPSIYKYYTAPKLDKDAYLLGEVADWESLNLLPGEANIIFEGTYIGKSFIDPNSIQDTLNLTLGRDKRVVVLREKLADYSSVKFLGTNKKQTFTYELTVKNNKKEKINMILKDQYPLSTTREIEVELLQSDKAFVNEETGVLTWPLELAPGEVKKVRVSYSVKYPKDKVINVN
jgi:hypothetical protein